MSLHRTQWKPRDFVGDFTIRVLANERYRIRMCQAIGRIIGKHNVILVALIYDAGIVHANRFRGLKVDAPASKSRL